MKIIRSSIDQNTRRQRGFSILEFLIAMVVLTVGTTGLLPLLIASITINKTTAGDTTSTMIAEVVLEQVSSAGANYSLNGGVMPNPIQDCASPANSWTVNVADAIVAGGNGGTYGGNGANLTSTGSIDWTQTYASIPAGYAMRYVACSTTNDTPVTYEVRWDVITTSSAEQTKMMVISARPLNPVASGFALSLPANLRTIVGM